MTPIDAPEYFTSQGQSSKVRASISCAALQLPNPSTVCHRMLQFSAVNPTIVWRPS